MDLAKLDIQLDKILRRKIVNLRFKLLQSIGQGQYGKVLLAEDLSLGPNKYVAIKTIHRVDTARLITKTYLSHTTKIKREIQIMKECDHPNVVKLIQVIDDMKFDKILLVLEYCALGEIDWKKYNHYHEKYYKDASKRLTLNRILRDVANGLEYLHLYKHIIHRDLKPSNLLIGGDRTIKIADFGVSLILENNANDDRELGKTMGTPAFFAPELCQFVNNRLLLFNENDLRRSSIDSRIDIWSLGVTLYCLFYHQLPFEGFNEFGLFKNIVNGVLRFPTTRNSLLAQNDDLREAALLENLISGLLEKDPLKRPTLDQIKRHGFTNFDLSAAESEKFLALNRNLISSQNPQAAEAFAAENRLTQRLRKLFISRTESGIMPEVEPPKTKSATERKREIQVPTNTMDLENVDDLLDSYLDDSSSFGSFDEDDTEPQVVNAADLFDSLQADEPEEKPQLRESASNATISKIKDLPPPLKLANSTFDGTKNSRPVVTIGPDSPLSANPVFSPSRRFFLRFKKKPTEPTISALTGNLNDALHYSKLAPPPTFGDSWDRSTSNRNLVSSLESGPPFQLSRKNSVSSTTSGAISKISSSSSSLNLHAYLMESPVSASKRNSFQSAIKEESRQAESSSGDNSDDDPDRTMSMDQFLDRLDG